MPKANQQRLTVNRQISLLRCMLSPLSIGLVAIHCAIVLIWYLLFFTREPPEVPVDSFVFAIDFVPLLAVNCLVGPDFVLGNDRFLDYLIMSVLGSIQWWCIGAAVTAAWEWWYRHEV